MTLPRTHPTPAPTGAPRATIPGRLRTVWSGLVGAIGALVGLAPHVLHHVGVLAGTALVAGAGGSALFGVLGLIASVPMLWRLRRRFNSWWAPGIALVVFAAMFALSTFVVGPLISGGGDASPGGGDSPTPATTDHTGHHGS